jgi:anti-sigma regulatory factor (Ser/Thr protein kinase)
MSSSHPRQWEDLTPEQQAAFIEFAREFGRRLAEQMQQLEVAFRNLATVCAEAARNVEAMGSAVRDDGAFVLEGDIPWVADDVDATPTPDGDTSS